MEGLLFDQDGFRTATIATVSIANGALTIKGSEAVFGDPEEATLNNKTRNKTSILKWQCHVHVEGGERYPFTPTNRDAETEEPHVIIDYNGYGDDWRAVVPEAECVKRRDSPLKEGDQIDHVWPINNKKYAAVVRCVGIGDAVHARYCGEWNHEIFDRWLLPEQVVTSTIVTGAATPGGGLVPLTTKAVAYIKHVGVDLATE